jgi:hypothetical protein
MWGMSQMVVIVVITVQKNALVLHYAMNGSYNEQGFT